MQQRFILPILALSCLASSPLKAEAPLRIAVAANLLPVMEQIAAQYQIQTGDSVQLVGGSSGAFFEQLRRGAPYDVFYSADSERPAQLAAQGLGEPARTYACGKLALWTPQATPDLNALPEGKLAIAQPDTAPYGKAALQALERSGQLIKVKEHLVYAQDIGQAYQFVFSGHAPAGLIALSQLTTSQTPAEQYLQIDSALYDPLVQKQIILAKDKRLEAAMSFVTYFNNQHTTLHNAGYSLPGEAGCAAQ